MTEDEDSTNQLDFDYTKIKVKTEKFDEEIECKLNPAAYPELNGNHEEEPLNVNVEDDKKSIEPVKSSNEILAELFKVFNVVAPPELLDDATLIKRVKKKKDKKEKKEKKKSKKSKSGDESPDGSEKSHNGKHKRKKNKKEKGENSVKIEKKKHDKNDKDKSKNLDPKDKKERKRKLPEQEEGGVVEKSSPTSVNGRQNTREPEAKRIKKERSVSKSRERKDKKLEKSKSTRNESDVSLSDEETYLQQKQREPRSKVNSFYGNEDRKYRDRSRSDRYDHHRSNYNRNSHDRLGGGSRYRRRSRDNYRFRSRSRSKERDLGIDKKRLLEIARKNAITMFKSGSLPGCVGMTEEIKDKVLLKMRYGGKTVQDLTEFCKKLSNGENLNDLSDFSSDEESDHDRDGNTKAFHHPFVIKDREPIVMHIRNAIPIQPKSAEQSKAILMQFPVSSGQEHRVTEEWVPVAPKKVEPPKLVKPLVPPQPLKPAIEKNVFQKPLPVDQQLPAFKPVILGGADPAAETSTTTVEETVVSTTPAIVPPPTEAIPDPPIAAAEPTPSVFPNVDPSKVDVSTIITRRLNAMRRLQENPMDSEAIKMMYSSQKEMTSWASSKFTPGQFTGSTGVNVLTARELSGGYQAWARKNQLTATVPVTGGMGMHLLKKMGWKPGEGLGREKNGALQPLLLDVKLDRRGIVANEDNGDNRQAGGGSGGGVKRRPGGAVNIAQAQKELQSKHPVCLLNELAAKRRWTVPTYDLVQDGGPSHHRMFTFKVNLNGNSFQPNHSANTKKDAKFAAAKHCLQQIGILPT